MTPSVRLFAFLATVIALGSVALDLALLEFFGVYLLLPLSLLVYVGVGLVLTLRLPRQPVGWLLLGTGTLLQVATAANAYSWAAFIRGPGTLPFGEIALVSRVAWIPAVGCLLLAIILFPTGRPPSRRWGWAVAFVPIAISLLAAASLAPQQLQVAQPIGAQGAPPLTLANPLATGGTLAMLLAYASPFAYVVFLLPVAGVLVRFRTATGTERQQLKWFAYTSSIALLFLFSFASGVLPALLANLAGAAIPSALLGPPLGLVVVDLIPISVAVAILRYRLYDIDLLINRTIVYAVTSTAIAVTFFLGLVALQGALRPLTSGSELAVAASTVFSFALFQPIRRRVQDAVNRRFDRARYNAARTVDGFADRLRDSVNLTELRADLLGAVQLTMAPSHVSLWLRERAR